MGAGSSSLDKVPARSHSSAHVIAVESVTSKPESDSRNERLEDNDTVLPAAQNKESVKIKKFQELRQTSPVSDAEKMLRIYTREQALVDGYVMVSKRPKKAMEEDVKVHSVVRDDNGLNKRDISIESEKNNLSKVPREVSEKSTIIHDQQSTQRTKQIHVKPPAEKFIFDNAEILKKKTSDLPVLNPVLDKQSKQTDILNQLGKQGIINKRSDPEKVMNDLRHIGMVKPESDKEDGYTLSMGTPKRTAPRLQPLHVHLDTMQTTYAPWEHDILKQQRHGNDENEDDSVTHARNTISNNEKLKLKIMDIDLL